MKAVNFGIDLGTTNSLIAKYENGNVVLFRNPVGHKECLPSVVAFRKEKILVGDKAREYLLKDTINVFGGFKRRMGSDDRFYVVNKDENVTPVALSAYVLKELKQFVHTGEQVEAAVITIPASFDTIQANATIRAGKLAGFKAVFLLQEPIAAGLAYFNHQNAGCDGYRLVYDLGGGTFDVALVETKNGEMKVKDHAGNNFLGGTDFDTLIVENLMLPHIVEKTGIIDLAEQLTHKYGEYEKLYYLMRYYAEEIKKELTIRNEAEVDFSMEINGQTYDFFFNVTVEQFNELIAPKVEETIRMIHDVLERNSLTANNINEIILVGGSTMIPYIRTKLQDAGIPTNTNADPITAIAVGAAYYAANKYYLPTEKSDGDDSATHPKPASGDADYLRTEAFHNAATVPQLVLSYRKMSRDDEEALLIKADGDPANLSYRITRSDGGFDTGLKAMKEKSTEFLPLLPNLMNRFQLRVFDAEGKEIQSPAHNLHIMHGPYDTSGQPLPKDICIELDDTEAQCTRLEVVFEKNSILPLKKTLYREISKTIRKNSSDSIIIHILEGDRFARPASNIPIGTIEITGKQLTSDLLKRSDIEIRIAISDNRELTVETFLVMTQQEFKNTFSVAEKSVNVSRLKEQYASLEIDIRASLKQFYAENCEIWAVRTQNLLNELKSYETDLVKLKNNDATDKRYIIAEAVVRISQEFDRVGGTERLEALRNTYYRVKETVEQALPSVDENRETLAARYRKIIYDENRVLLSRNPAVIRQSINRLNDLYGDMLWNSNAHIVSRFYRLKNYPERMFINYQATQKVFESAEKAIRDNRYIDLRRMIIDLYNMLRSEKSGVDMPEQTFKGIGIS